jgi:DNA mismatch repair protein MutS
LKIGFNKVFGYYIEVSKSYQDKVPDHYIRKQTLVNCERYITEELKVKEDEILNAEERLSKLEFDAFQQFRQESIPFISNIRKLSVELSQLDVLQGFAYLANSYNYVKPVISPIGTKGKNIIIKDGRHPVVERLVGDEFISNDTILNDSDRMMNILTGPNMSGKSTYIRQVALITLLAQIGCFVPATSAEITLVDRIFTRVGASDDLTRGRSTFMVEMDEAANILNNATEKLGNFR